RDARYSLLRGYFHGADDDTVEERERERLSTVTLPGDARAVGKPLSQFSLNALGVRVASLRRANGQAVPLDGQPLLADGDALVLSGVPESLALAEEQLLRG
ncbi:MAG: putative rane component of transport system, Kef type, partial [Ramlibacter sp.]|nr:putative rane component of transport system, Kef type [Ramlibacter sp.]